MRPDIAKVIYEPSRRCDNDDDVYCGNGSYRRRNGRPIRQHALRHTRKTETPADRCHGDTTGQLDAEDMSTAWSDLDMPDAPLQEPTHRFSRARRLRFAALAGWCRKQVGRRWDDAFAELRAAMPGDTKVERRIQEWIKVYIRPANEVYLHNGKAYEDTKYRKSAYTDGILTDSDLISSDRLFVDPRDGIVKWGSGPANWHGSGRLRGDPIWHNLRPLDHRKVDHWILDNGGELFWNPGERTWMHKYTWQRPVPGSWPVWSLYAKPRYETVSRIVKAGRKQLRDLGFRQVRD